MFEKKINKLIEKPAKATLSANDNPFVRITKHKQLKKESKTVSGNGAVKFSATADPFVNQFADMSKWKEPRSFLEIAKDMRTLWDLNSLLTLKFAIYTRLITRTPTLSNGNKLKSVQRGAGLKNEGLFRMMWVAVYYPKIFYSNLSIFIAAGSWKDIFKMLSIDLQYNGWDKRMLDWNKFQDIIIAGLENEQTNNLVKKYLPQIRSTKNSNTIEAQANLLVAKWICSFLFGTKGETSGYTYKQYRLLKTSGTAHQWQQLISKGKLLEIDFSTVHGRALAQLVSSKFLKNHDLEHKYTQWIESQPVAKFTGYPYELFAGKARPTGYLASTVNKQFQMLVDTAKKGIVGNNIRPIAVLDTSGSMNSLMYIGNGKTGNMSSKDVARASLLFFNEMLDNKSPFYNHYLAFSDKCTIHELTGDTYVDKFYTRPNHFSAGTNFQSVFKFLADFKRKNPKIDENHIPNFIVCFSDGEFNRTVDKKSISNVKAGLKQLREAGFSEEYTKSFGLCFIDCPNTFYGRPITKFETFEDVPNVFYFAGYDMSPLAFLFGVEGHDRPITTASGLFSAAMDQEILNLLTVE